VSSHPMRRHGIARLHCRNSPASVPPSGRLA
jgi:hypothetical protein